MELTFNKNKIASAFVDLFLPKVCFHCKANRCEQHDLLCASCLKELHEVTIDELNYEASKKFSSSDFVSNLFSLYRFTKESPIQTLLHELKYQNKFNIGKMFGEQLAKKYFHDFLSLGIDIVVPVPLHRVKKAERGYNQAFYFAKGIAKILDCKVRTDIIYRKRFTKSQTKLNQKEREENVREAFYFQKKINGENVLLVDDVITTGSTIISCARVIKECGAKNIYTASIALA